MQVHSNLKLLNLQTCNLITTGNAINIWLVLLQSNHKYFHKKEGFLKKKKSFLHPILCPELKVSRDTHERQFGFLWRVDNLRKQSANNNKMILNHSPILRKSWTKKKHVKRKNNKTKYWKPCYINSWRETEILVEVTVPLIIGSKY